MRGVSVLLTGESLAEREVEIQDVVAEGDFGEHLVEIRTVNRSHYTSAPMQALRVTDDCDRGIAIYRYWPVVRHPMGET